MFRSGEAGLDNPALDQLFDLVYEELRRLAHRVRGGRAGETLSTPPWFTRPGPDR